jgi:hypothetical protein
MALTVAQKAIWQKVRALGAGAQAAPLSDEASNYLLGRMAIDLQLQDRMVDLPGVLPEFFSGRAEDLLVPRLNPIVLFEQLVTARSDADTYFACLGALHKARLKYERILQSQPLPTIEQVGPRALLQYGQISPAALRSFLFWRKWFFDIDNRAGQETGYLFEPVIAFAVGGTPAPAKKSPIRRHADPTKGRQADCILDRRAYEFKIRVTIAASGQGRWQEELDFAIDCRQSGYTPVLVCMDPTPNEKLTALAAAFRAEGGEVYIGDDAWMHLENLAGETMSVFLEKYIRAPLNELIDLAGAPLLDLTASASENVIQITVGGEELRIHRRPRAEDAEVESMPEDADDAIPGA